MSLFCSDIMFMMRQTQRIFKILSLFFYCGHEIRDFYYLKVDSAKMKTS